MEQKFILIEATFIDKLSGTTMVKLLDLKTGGVHTIKIKVVRNVGFLDMTNNSSEHLISHKNKSLGVLDLRSIGYYKVKQNNIQHHLELYYEFRSLQALYEEFNKLTNNLRSEEQKSTNPFPWLAEEDERRNLSEKEILGNM